MPTKGYHYVQRRYDIESYDKYGFPRLKFSHVAYVGCDKKRRFRSKADVTQIWLVGPNKCSHITTFTSPWYSIAQTLGEQEQHARTQQQNDGATRTDTKAKSNGNGGRPRLAS